jgi:Ca2+ transporting ATPase
MLWVNLIMDSLGSLALATEPPYEELLQRMPTKRTESILNGKMWKHIIIQSCVQIAILLILYLLAPKFIRERDLIRLAENYLIYYCYGTLPGNTDPKNIIYGTESSWDNNIRLLKTIDNEECGGFSNRINLNLAYQEYYNSNGASTHMTILFNVFVYYTLFNQINCRVIDDSFNIFVRMNKSLLFPLICFVEMALQAVIIEFGNEALHVVERGLTLNQWGFTLLFSCITFFISIIVKIIPFEKVIDKILDRRQSEKDRKHEEEIMKKHKILNEDAQSIDSIKDSRVVIHKKVLNYDRNDETKTTKESKTVMSYRSNNKIKV